MKLREQIELADKKLELMGFDSVDKAVIFCTLSHAKRIDWLLNADEDKINAWYNRIQAVEKVTGI
ncbi:MAG: hypothetical protein WC998_10020 [Candidatus Paceibacterota bacterium]|jgi:hypothetical protein